jgi:pimeloyl-ACP methyl ester carboxylesterase
MERFFADDGAELAFVERGSGSPALLFVHGWQGDRSVWDGVVDALGPQRHTLAIDLRGCGDSRNAAGPYRLERFAADLRDLIAARDLGPVVVVGHSMGGTIALRFAVDSPDFVRALILIAPVAASGGAYSEKGLAYLRGVARDESAVRAWLARTVEQPPDETTLDRLSAVAAETTRAAALESFESFAHADFAERTRAIAAPALVIASEHDAPGACERRVASLLPNVTFVTLRDAAHYAIVERPSEIAATIRSFV